MNAPSETIRQHIGWFLPTVAKLIMLITFCLCLCQCSEVLPWQRGKLADYTMRPDRDTVATTLGDHIFFSREAATGGRGIGGGGCGCN